jgi:hypothetical protein
MENYTVLPKFDGLDQDIDPEIWIKQFERYAVLKTWSVENRWKHFPLWLSGQAQRWFDSLTDAVKTTPNDLKQHSMTGLSRTNQSNGSVLISLTLENNRQMKV